MYMEFSLDYLNWGNSYTPNGVNPNNFAPGANFIEVLKQKFCLSTKIARLFYTCYWPKFYAIYIAHDLYLAVVYLA